MFCFVFVPMKCLKRSRNEDETIQVGLVWSVPHDVVLGGVNITGLLLGGGGGGGGRELYS